MKGFPGRRSWRCLLCTASFTAGQTSWMVDLIWQNEEILFTVRKVLCNFVDEKILDAILNKGTDRMRDCSKPLEQMSDTICIYSAYNYILIHVLILLHVQETLHLLFGSFGTSRRSGNKPGEHFARNHPVSQVTMKVVSFLLMSLHCSSY